LVRNSPYSIIHLVENGGERPGKVQLLKVWHGWWGLQLLKGKPFFENGMKKPCLLYHISYSLGRLVVDV
jgi:hypothetical protein